MEKNIFEFGEYKFDLTKKDDVIQALYATQGAIASRVPKEFIDNDSDVNLMIVLASNFREINFINPELNKFMCDNSKKYISKYKTEQIEKAKTEEEKQKVKDKLDSEDYYTSLSFCLANIFDDYFTQRNSTNQPQ